MTHGVEMALWGACFLVGTLGQCLCAGMEMGVYSVNRVRLSIRAGGARPSRSALLLRRELENMPRLLAALLIGFNIFGYIGGIGLTNLLEGWGYEPNGIVLMTIFVAGPILFVVSDTLPKELFRAMADRMTYAVAPVLAAMRVLLTWTAVLPLVQGLAKLVTKLLPPQEGEVADPRQRIAALLQEGAQHGAISESQATLLDRALALRERTVEDELVAWSRCQTIFAGASREQIIAVVSNSPYSRLPVVDARGQVLGVVEQLSLSLDPDRPVAELMKPALFIEPSKPVTAALRQMADDGSRLAIVRAKGRAVGIVTAKDLVEPLTGELKAW